jgi:subtilisin family serine protease
LVPHAVMGAANGTGDGRVGAAHMGGTTQVAVIARPALPGFSALDPTLIASIAAGCGSGALIFADLDGDGDLELLASSVTDGAADEGTTPRGLGGMQPIEHATFVAGPVAAENGGQTLAFGASLFGLGILDPYGGFFIGADDLVLLYAAFPQFARDDGVIASWAAAPFLGDDRNTRAEGGFAGLSAGAVPEAPGGDSPRTAVARSAGKEPGAKTVDAPDAAPAQTVVAPDFAPADPLYGPTVFTQQWHFSRIGNIERIWDEFTGAGVKVGVYDTGVQYTHWDLDGNYDASNHLVIDGVTYDGAPVLDDNGTPGDPSDDFLDGHGTHSAGLIAAEANGVGTVGVAFGAKITGVNIFDPDSGIFLNGTDTTRSTEALRQSSRFDIVNNSWGGDPEFLDGQNTRVEGSRADERENAWAQAAAEGRGGLGTIIVKSAGNDWGNAVAEGLNGSRYKLTVAATGNITYTEADGHGLGDFATDFSNHGTPILVAAPGIWITTTDLLGADGFNIRSKLGVDLGPSDDTNYYGGTSASAPIVSGVVALMLDANPGLGWRDVHDILAASATRIGSELGATGPGTNENGVWQINAADGWNGGGMHVHTNYGYGMVNAYNAVRMAEVWSEFAPAQTSANEILATSGRITPAVAIPDLSTVTCTFSFSGNVEIGHAEFVLSATHDYYAEDLRIFLTSAEGTRVQLWDGTRNGTNNAGAWPGNPSTSAGWAYGIEHLRGEDPNGT